MPPSVDRLPHNTAADFQVLNFLIIQVYAPFTTVFQDRRFSPVLRAAVWGEGSTVATINIGVLSAPRYPKVGSSGLDMCDIWALAIEKLSKS